MPISPTAKLFGGKALTGGSPKQREWAEKIRADKLALIALEEDAIALCDPRSLARGAVFWIHNRHRQPHEFAEFINESRRLRDLCAALKEAGNTAEYRLQAEKYNEFTFKWGFYK